MDSLDPMTLTWFLAGTSLSILVALLLGGRRGRAEQRITELSATTAGSTSPNQLQLGPSMRSLTEAAVSKRLKKEERRNQFRTRVVQAGLYGRNATVAFFTLRAVAIGLPVALGVFFDLSGGTTKWHGTLVGTVLAVAGNIAPSFWLDHVKRARQKAIRRALPDALDIISVCLEGGMSLSASLARVARELATAHPMLALELAIVERETQMGRTTGQAMREFAKRFDVEELRSLSSVVIQAEKFGSSVTHALEVYADTLRLKRHQHAEEMAQKAVIKIIFPTLLCVFPGIFVVILGPAAIQVYKLIIQGALKGL